MAIGSRTSKGDELTRITSVSGKSLYITCYLPNKDTKVK